MSGEKFLYGLMETKKITKNPRIPRIKTRYMTRSMRVVVVIIARSIVIFAKFSTIFCFQIFYRSKIFAISVFFIIAYFCNKYFLFEKGFMGFYFYKNFLMQFFAIIIFGKNFVISVQNSKEKIFQLALYSGISRLQNQFFRYCE